METPREMKVSYCTTCHGRLWQIALTLYGNLDRLHDDEELVLLDYGSPDGLGRFVESSQRCREAIESGHLVYGHTEAPKYHCPKAKNLAHRLARGQLLVNLDADNSNRGMRRVIDRNFPDPDADVILQMDEGARDDPLRGTFGRICIPRYWFYRLGGYDEAFQPIGHQDGDLLWRAKAMGLQRVSSRTGGPPPIRNTMVEKASHTGDQSWHNMWRANERASRRNLKEGRLIANLQGWGAADVWINFNEVQTLAPVTPQLVSLVVLARQPKETLEGLLGRYDHMPLVGEILLVNRNPDFAIEQIENTRSKVTIINTSDEPKPFAGLAAASLASFSAVLLTCDEVLVPAQTLSDLHKAWFGRPSILHGIAVASEDGVAPVAEISRPEDIALGQGVLANVPACVSAMAYSSTLCNEAPDIADERAEDILLFFVAARSGNGLNRAYRLPLEHREGMSSNGGRLSRRSRTELAPVVRWCRANVSAWAPSDLAIAVGPSAPKPVDFPPTTARSFRDSVLFAGPWVGEFGWELCWWNPMLRALAESFEHVIVAAPASSSYLYEFAAEFIPLRTEGWRFTEGKLLSKVPPVCSGSTIVTPAELWEEFGLQECKALRSGEPSLTPKKWRSLAPMVPGQVVADVLCAFRPRKVVDGQVVEGKEYAWEESAELVRLLQDAGLAVACYGGKDNFGFEGALDLRGALLEVQCAALSSARCAVGPSSGPLHLASLCGCPVITWSRLSHDVSIRYETHWNPFGAPIRFLEAPDPPPYQVAIETLHLIDALSGVRLVS